MRLKSVDKSLGIELLQESWTIFRRGKKWDHSNVNVLGYIVYFGSGYIYLELVFHSFELNEKILKSYGKCKFLFFPLYFLKSFFDLWNTIGRLVYKQMNKIILFPCLNSYYGTNETIGILEVQALLRELAKKDCQTTFLQFWTSLFSVVSFSSCFKSSWNTWINLKKYPSVQFLYTKQFYKQCCWRKLWINFLLLVSKDP